MGTNRLLQLLPELSKQKILVIGDMMLDSYLKGTSTRLCREAPVPIVDVKEWTHAPGGAANTAINLAKLGAKTTFLSIGGADAEGVLIMSLLRKEKVNTEGIFLDRRRKTLAKRRVFSGSQLLVRFDYGSEKALHKEYEQKFKAFLETNYQKYNAIILSDYCYGAITPGVMNYIGKLQKIHNKVLIVDSKDLTKFKRIHPTAVKPNYGEALKLLNISEVPAGQRIDQILAEGKSMLSITGAEIAAITVDTEGGVIFQKGYKPFRTYTKPVENTSAAGAGDTFVAALTLSLAAGASALHAAEIAAAAAAVVVQKEGTSTCSIQEIKDYFRPEHKVITAITELAERCHAYHEQGRTIVFTNGFFDILHRGHIEYLSKAKEKGDILVVGVNSDESMQRLKRIQQPINTLSDRIQVLSALSTVDHVIAYDEDTAENLIRAIKPDVYAKGGDYSKQTIKEAPLAEELGGNIEIIPYVSLPQNSQIKTVTL